MDISNINYDFLIEKYQDIIITAADTLWEMQNRLFRNTVPVTC